MCGPRELEGVRHIRVDPRSKGVLTERFESIWTKGAIIEAKRDETGIGGSGETHDDVVDRFFIQGGRRKI